MRKDFEVHTIPAFGQDPKRIVQLTIDMEFVREWSSIMKASKELDGVYTRGVTSCCQGKRKTAGGFKWMYKEDYDKMIEEQNNESI